MNNRSPFHILVILFYQDFKVLVRSAEAQPRHLKFHSDFEIPIEYSDSYMKHYVNSDYVVEICLIDVALLRSRVFRSYDCVAI